MPRVNDENWEDKTPTTVAEQPDYITTAALTKELRDLHREVKRQGEAIDRLSVAMTRQTTVLEHLAASLDRKRNRK
jgi:hypothetical protein